MDMPVPRSSVGPGGRDSTERRARDEFLHFRYQQLQDPRGATMMKLDGIQHRMPVAPARGMGGVAAWTLSPADAHAWRIVDTPRRPWRTDVLWSAPGAVLERSVVGMTADRPHLFPRKAPAVYESRSGFNRCSALDRTRLRSACSSRRRSAEDGYRQPRFVEDAASSPS
jgi:hypothetical protein